MPGEVLELAIGTIVIVVFLYVCAPPLTVAVENWFYGGGGPKNGISEFISEFMHTRVWFYLGFSIVLWLGGAVGVTVIGRAERMSSERAAERTLNLSHKAITHSDIAPAAGEKFLKEIREELSRERRERENKGYHLGWLGGVSIAVLLTCLARASTVLYHGSLMRSALLTVLVLIGAALLAGIVFSESFLAAIGIARARAGETVVLIPFWAGLATFAGMVVESLLGRKAPKHWGRSAGESVPRATYSCIVCGCDQWVPVSNQQLRKCSRCGKELLVFRRKTSGW